MKITITNSAFKDLESIKEYYESEGVPHVGQHFIENIILHIETLKENRDIGRVVPEFNSIKIRELIHTPFRVVYVREKRSIHVVKVWRSERLMKLPDSSNDIEI